MPIFKAAPPLFVCALASILDAASVCPSIGPSVHQFAKNLVKSTKMVETRDTTTLDEGASLAYLASFSLYHDGD